MNGPTGELLIDGGARRGRGAAFHAIDAATGAAIAEPVFHGALPADVEAACALADAAFDVYRALAAARRADFLDDIAARIEALGDALIVRAMAETGLPRARLEGERARTANQLRMFAALVRGGDALDVRIEPALPERQPPRSDLRFLRIGVGPVAVFGASNFPLAFSVAGGDTAASLAAGCPVVVKAHPAHPGTSELVGRAVQAAVRAASLPAGVFALVADAGHEVGRALVAHPAIRAVGFTGSRAGGLALAALAAARPVPIPVYAEMSSVNPNLMLPGALAARAEPLAREFVASVTLGCGQFCTNPGLALGIAGAGFDAFAAAAARALRDVPAGVMLSAGILRAYEAGVARLAGHPAVDVVARGAAGDGRAQAALLRVSARALMTDATLADEVFGPSSVLVECASADEMREAMRRLEGQLTVTLHLSADDHDLARTLLPIVERRAGRILANGFPTGVEVCDAIVHGGPFPATSDGRGTSVGTAAIERFQRPVCYQNVDGALLPDALRDGNPLGVPRRVGGRREAAAPRQASAGART
ncbi:aldehyde dehydrogenase (NADP(+)) [Burkholderia thailandensis]|uniref:aldehyde dehydrogenase (NADP(+)) n=3 Tax=Burkholderia thailandensis TaxID=57975 RepID=UPI0014082334|nr:aldehyde dehydrogenase (NADP(+)) [Burkholderia thailandensis]MCS3397307.1 aldehyde dehydrogenase (NADP(+)) [Burkholderia thailandensis]QIO14327.1 aldehyde dehydrogenase (NADP(+)) [Burkholderia thailandensis]